MKRRSQDNELVLSDRDREIFVNALINPPAPNQRLIRGMKQARKMNRQPPTRNVRDGRVLDHLVQQAIKEIRTSIRSADKALKSALKSAARIRNKKPRPIGLTKDVALSHSSRITVNPKIRSGKPCVRNLRITVRDVLKYLASGMTEKQILKKFPDLTPADIRACLTYASGVVEGTIFDVQGSIRPHAAPEDFDLVRRTIKRPVAKKTARMTAPPNRIRPAY